MKRKFLIVICIAILTCALLTAFAACTKQDNKTENNFPARTERGTDESSPLPPADEEHVPTPLPFPAPPMRPQPRLRAPMPGKRPHPHAPLHPTPDEGNAPEENGEADKPTAQ